jgi:hypothetical protein
MTRWLKGALLLAMFAGADMCLAATVSPNGCRTLRLHGKKNEATDCFEALARSGDAYLMAEGYWGLEGWKEAEANFEIAIKQPKAPALWKARYGRLLHERFNDVESPPLFGEALQQDPACAEALLGLAEVSAANFDDKAQEFVAKAIAADPKLVEAHELAANLLLEDAKPDEAVKEANTAIALSPYQGGSDALDAMATLAAADLLADKNADADAWMAKIKVVNPGYGMGYVSVARHLVLNRRYPEGVAYYRKAVEADPNLWVAHSELGINLMRLGEEDEPRQQLELAYNNAQTDNPTSNSLKLLDSYKNFVTTKDETTVLRLYKNESELLRPYFEEQLHKAIATYSTKYKMKLSGPVQLEVYPNHEDFAVRTMGMPGLGALGVTFGDVVAMDSPSGRVPGEFNWGATMWHEMSHVFILSATNYRVPRWFTEGLAVHEEGQANPKWANRMTPEVLAAIKAKKLLPVAKMDQGFIFPEYPEQVLVSYWQAGTILDYIYEHWGEDAILGMVHSYAEVRTTPEAIEANLHVTPQEFDTQYMAWLMKKVGMRVEKFDKWREQLKAFVELSKATDLDGTALAKALVEIIQMYPEYVGDANAYEFLAKAQLAKKDDKGAAETLNVYVLEGGENPDALKQLASLQEEAGAVREYEAVLAMKPLDMASAEFDLARAYFAAGDKAKAEDSVLASLEAAPGFKDAQKLLLEIEAGQNGQEPNVVKH